MGKKCEACDKETDFFDGADYGYKCIFHCDKSDNAKWGHSDSIDVGRFWRAIRWKMNSEIEQNSVCHNFYGYIFPVFEEHSDLQNDKNSEKWFFYEEVNFWIRDNNGKSYLQFLKEPFFKRAVFKYPVYFVSVHFKIKANFDFAIFEREIKFINNTFASQSAFSCNFAHFYEDFEIHKILGKIEDFSISNAKFKKNFIFDASHKLFRRFYCYGLEFSRDSSVKILNLKCDNFDFKELKSQSYNTKFSSIVVNKALSIKDVMFDKTEFNGIDLSLADSIKLENTSFIGSHLTNIKWGKINENRLKIDRQMARQLKSINDAQGETIIANDFYALEMRLRSKELNWREHFGEKLVQNIHELISNHSNDWVLATIWFFAFGFLFSTLAKAGLIFSVPFILLLATVGLGVYEADKNLNDYSHRIFASAIFSVSLFCFCLFVYDFEFFASLINPLNFKDSKDLLANTNLLLVYSCRLIEIFTGYQIITAIRKNTRRK